MARCRLSYRVRKCLSQVRYTDACRMKLVVTVGLGLTILVSIVLLIWTVTPSRSKLKVTWYYETLCPGCRAWFKQALQPNYENFLDYVDFILIPYGNAETRTINGETSITCQHGDAECLGNKYQACALNLVKDNMKKLRYCLCIMTSDGGDVYRKCAQDKGIEFDFNALHECAEGAEGLKYLAACGDEQKKLEFKLPYVPFLTVDGKALTKPEENEAWAHFGQFLCKRLPGKKPKVCQ